MQNFHACGKLKVKFRIADRDVLLLVIQMEFSPASVQPLHYDAPQKTMWVALQLYL
jgi:hypothetical protein